MAGKLRSLARRDSLDDACLRAFRGLDLEAFGEHVPKRTTQHVLPLDAQRHLLE